MNNIAKAVLTCAGVLLIQYLSSLIQDNMVFPFLISSFIFIIILGIIFLNSDNLKPVGIGLLLAAVIDIGWAIHTISKIQC